MNKDLIIKKTAEYAESILKGEGTGHDFWHVYRVWKMAIQIAKREKADLFIVELGALLHDIADWKFHDGDFEAGPKVAREVLKKIKVSDDVINKVCDIVRNVSFKGAGVKSEMKSLEGKIVQDADRLDAIGAIGIARTIMYGSSKGIELYNPKISPQVHKTFKQYKNNSSTTINHFYEKLLLLKDLMNTKTGKKMAMQRHRFMESYLKQFLLEWDGFV